MSDFVHGDSEREVYREKDIEAGVSDINASGESSPPNPYENGEYFTVEEIRARKLQQEKGFLRSLRRGEEWLDEKMGIETQGIDRIKEEDKRPPSIWNVFFLWWSLTCHVGTIPIGLLGPEFGLSLNQSIAAIVVGTILGALCTSYTGTLGPKVRLELSNPNSNPALIISSLACALLRLLDTLSASTELRSARSSILSLVVDLQW